MGDVVELDFRESSGFEVALLWHRSTNGLVVLVHNVREQQTFLVPVHPAEALEVFRHPYAYCRRGVLVVP